MTNPFTDAELTDRWERTRRTFGRITAGDRVTVRFGETPEEHEVSAIDRTIQTISFVGGGGCTWHQVEAIAYADGTTWVRDA